jgi:hypothetical protein
MLVSLQVSNGTGSSKHLTLPLPGAIEAIDV